MQMEYGKVEEVEIARRKGNEGLVESATLARAAALSADEKKGKDVRILDIRSISSVADYFVICTGTSTTHVRAIVDNVEEQLSGLGLTLHHMEGYQNGRWILLDFSDIVVHVMQQQEREFYNLERLWGDAPEVKFSEAV
ncbi:MAG TPA: ribosome silencing factor [Symbiobacteriaceae bacterium]|nr:ribosome silencing factor [Symbiobacteriaceae bacterium]